MNVLRLQLSLLFLLPVILLLGNTVPAPTDGPALSNGYTDPPLADFLNPDGTLNITPGFSGQIDISGYHLQLDECAGPVAAPDGMASATGTWSALGLGLNGTVNTIAVAANGDLYVGGTFTEAGGAPANRIAKWDGTNWSALGSGLNSQCNTIAITPNGDVYAGGLFSTAGGVTVDNIAAWDGTNWSAVGSGSSVFACYTLTSAQDGTLYAGGSWVNIGGVRSFSIASWDGTSWSTLGSGLASSSGSIGLCFDIAIAPDGSIYAAGEFATAGGTPALNIARWDGTNWSALGAGINDRVNAIDFANDGTLYATGVFTEAGGSPAGAIAKWDGTNWSALGSGLGFTDFDFGLGIKAASDGNVYVVGQFDLTSGPPRNDKNIAKWDGTNWSGVGTGLSGFTNDVAESPSGGIYVGGGFGFDNGFPQVTLNRIARLNPPVPCDIAITSVEKSDESCPGEDDGSITINATCSSCASILYSIDGGATTQASPTFTELMPGTYQPYVEDSGDDTCTDDAAEETIADGLDTEVPSITCPGSTPAVEYGDMNNCQTGLPDYTVFADASDNCTAEMDLVLTQDPVAGEVFTGEQTVTVTVTATDEAGLSSACTYMIEYVDVGNPMITCPSNATVQATGATCTPTVNDIAASATDNCTMDPSITYSTTGATTISGSGDASGNTFAVGTTTVTYTATDDAMQPNEANCSFTITVQDNTDCGCSNPQPGDSCDDEDPETDNDVIQDDCSCAGTSCDIAILSVNETDETCPEEGDGTITINASCTSCDGILYSIDGGATTQASNVFTGLVPATYQPYVVDSGDDSCNDADTNVAIGTEADTEDPTAICPTISDVAITENGTGTLPANIGQGLSTDNCGTPTETSPMLYFDCDDLGPQTVALTADDGNGNTDTEQCSFMVVLPDGPLPPWSTSDIGQSQNEFGFDPCTSGGEFSLASGGTNWVFPTNEDETGFIGQEICGDGSITVKVESVQDGLGGITIRESTDQGARMYSLFTDLAFRVFRSMRTATGANSQFRQFFKPHSWLRLERKGNLIWAYSSLNGVNFSLREIAVLPMGNCLKVGMAVSPYSASAPGSAVFSNVTVTGGSGYSLSQEVQETINGISLKNGAAPQPGNGSKFGIPAQEQGQAALFPNPTSGAFTLRFERPLQATATAVLRNELGQALQQLQLPAGTINHNFDGSTLPRGLYFLEVRDEQGYREVLKVVRQ